MRLIELDPARFGQRQDASVRDQDRPVRLDEHGVGIHSVRRPLSKLGEGPRIAQADEARTIARTVLRGIERRSVERESGVTVEYAPGSSFRDLHLPLATDSEAQQVVARTSCDHNRQLWISPIVEHPVCA